MRNINITVIISVLPKFCLVLSFITYAYIKVKVMVKEISSLCKPSILCRSRPTVLLILKFYTRQK
jgi:hypothetical protein